MTFVDIAGYFDVLATFSVTLQVVDRDGATKRLPTMEQAPVFVQVFFPVETDRMRLDRDVFDFLATVVFNTVKPGRADTFTDEGLLPADVCDETENEYSVPFVSPATVQVVAVVVHTVAPEDDDTTYVTVEELVTALHDNVTALLVTFAVNSVGAIGAITGAK